MRQSYIDGPGYTTDDDNDVYIDTYDGFEIDTLYKGRVFWDSVDISGWAIVRRYLHLEPVAVQGGGEEWNATGANNILEWGN